MEYIIISSPRIQKVNNYTQPTLRPQPPTSWREDKITEDMYPLSLPSCSLFPLPPSKPVFPLLLASSWAQLKSTTINRRRKQSLATHVMGSVGCSDPVVATSSRGRMPDRTQCAERAPKLFGCDFIMAMKTWWCEKTSTHPRYIKMVKHHPFHQPLLQENFMATPPCSLPLARLHAPKWMVFFLRYPSGSVLKFARRRSVR